MSEQPVSSARSIHHRPAIILAVLVIFALVTSLAFALTPADAAPEEASVEEANQPTDVVLAVHVGTASLREGDTDPERIEAYENGVTEALEAGRDVLAGGGRSVDAVQTAVEILEDDPAFQAGRGAVFNTNAQHELDASIMDGSNLDAGAVAAVQNIKNPIAGARTVLDDSDHVLLASDGADTFAREQGLEMVTQDYYFTQDRWDALMDAKEEDPDGIAPEDITDEDEKYHGTVGAVAIDANDDMAAATSTGGRNNKEVGRVGDSPLISAGTWAKNNNVAVSGTGVGEIYIRLGAARDVGALYEYRYRGNSQRAANEVLEKIQDLDGTGGLLVLDDRGRLSTPRTGGMPTGYVLSDGEIVLDILRED